MTRLVLALVALLAGFSNGLRAQSEDVTFFVIGKHANYDQKPDGSLAPRDFSFFSEIFLTAGGDASDAFLDLPTGERLRFRDQRRAPGPERDNLLLVRGGKRFSSYAELQSWFPDGDYGVRFKTPSGSVRDARLGFERDALPRPPRISLRQNGVEVCEIVNADLDLEVRWSRFDQGRKDANRILDDLIFVIVTDPDGQRVSHSGRPFEDRPFLTFSDQRHTVRAEALTDGRRYDLSVEHAVLNDTQRFDGVPAMTTYAVTSHRMITARSGAADGCEKQKEETAMRPSTDAQVVMLYYTSLAAADAFYGQTLGLEKTLDEDWVKFYRTSDSSYIGLVAEGEGAWHRVQPKNSVMVSIVTTEVDRWHERLDGKVRILKPLGDGGPIRSFLVEDPGGYTVEFFQWLTLPAP